MIDYDEDLAAYMSDDGCEPCETDIYKALVMRHLVFITIHSY